KASPRKKLKPSSSAMLTGEGTVGIKGSRELNKEKPNAQTISETAKNGSQSLRVRYASAVACRDRDVQPQSRRGEVMSEQDAAAPPRVGHDAERRQGHGGGTERWRQG